MRNLSLPFDGIFRALIIFGTGLVIIKYSTIFEEGYHHKLALLYTYPWWRLLVVFLLLSAILWCPRVGILVAVLVFFYLSDMDALMTPLPNL